MLEGYYIKGWENSAFYEIENNKVKWEPAWLDRTPHCLISDSLKTILDTASFRDGIYIKVMAQKNTGGSYGI